MRNNAGTAVLSPMYESQPSQSQPTTSRPIDYNINWLMMHVTDRINAGVNNYSGLTVQEFVVAVLQKVSTAEDEAELESELVDLCGYQWHESISIILTHRTQLLASFRESRGILTVPNNTRTRQHLPPPNLPVCATNTSSSAAVCATKTSASAAVCATKTTASAAVCATKTTASAAICAAIVSDHSLDTYPSNQVHFRFQLH